MVVSVPETNVSTYLEKVDMVKCTPLCNRSVPHKALDCSRDKVSKLHRWLVFGTCSSGPDIDKSNGCQAGEAAFAAHFCYLPMML